MDKVVREILNFIWHSLKLTVLQKGYRWPFITKEIYSKTAHEEKSTITTIVPLPLLHATIYVRRGVTMSSFLVSPWNLPLITKVVLPGCKVPVVCSLWSRWCPCIVPCVYLHTISHVTCQTKFPPNRFIILEVDIFQVVSTSLNSAEFFDNFHLCYCTVMKAQVSHNYESA
jgi:hypothetical protein